MNKVGRRFTFDLHEMFLLRREGWSYSALARKYEKDHTTILYHCRKWHVEPFIIQEIILPPEVEEQLQSLAIPRRLYKYDYLLNEPINKGKSYKEYLAEVTRRKFARLAIPQKEAGGIGNAPSPLVAP